MANRLQIYVKNRLAEMGKNPFELAREHGFERNFINEIITERKQSIRTDSMARLAAALGVSLDTFVRETSDAPIANTNIAPPPPIAVPHGPDEIVMSDVALGRTSMPQDVPVYGTAAGSAIGTFESFYLETGDPIDYVRRPPALRHVKSAYSFLVDGESMIPAHPPGELRFANPNKRVQVGDTVIVQTKNGEHAPLQCFIKVFVKRTPRGILVRQYNPEATMEFLDPTVLAVHHVMTMNELFGI